MKKRLCLLNTWNGEANENWDPSLSTILQVLLSLQALVLNSNAYFNEAGYNKQIGTVTGEQRSRFKNEDTFLLNCEMMVWLMKNPPEDFKELVLNHFKKRGPNILKLCEAYKSGNIIGSLAKDGSIVSTNGSVTYSNSRGFRKALTDYMPTLKSSLIDVGADFSP